MRPFNRTVIVDVHDARACSEIHSEFRAVPRSLSTWRNPRWLLTMARDVARPSPVSLPTALVVKHMSKMRSKFSEGMPMPLSSTRSSTYGPTFAFSVLSQK